MSPRLLDLFCCEGGAGVGYHRAGFDVVGVDIDRQPRYPFEFVQADALAVLADREFMVDFDAVHASPPCQAYSVTKHTHGVEHAELVGPVREALQTTGLPWVIENVVGAPLHSAVTLCGSEFGLTGVDVGGRLLRLKRHRLFEASFLLMGAGGCLCRSLRAVQVGGAYGGGSSDLRHARGVRCGGYTPPKSVRAQLLGVDWMTMHGQSQCVPPAYTEHVGAQLLAEVAMRGAA